MRNLKLLAFLTFKSTCLLKHSLFFINSSYFIWFSNFSLSGLFLSRNWIFHFQIFQLRALSHFLVLQNLACPAVGEGAGGQAEGLGLSDFCSRKAVMTFCRQLNSSQCLFSFIFLGHLLAYKMLTTEGDICLFKERKKDWQDIKVWTVCHVTWAPALLTFPWKTEETQEMSYLGFASPPLVGCSALQASKKELQKTALHTPTPGRNLAMKSSDNLPGKANPNCYLI